MSVWGSWATSSSRARGACGPCVRYDYAGNHDVTDDVVSTTYKSTAFLANTGTTPQPHCHANLIGSHILLRKCVPPLPPKKLSNFNRSSSFSVAGTDINDANEFNSFTARFFCSSVVVVMFWEGGQDMTVPQLLSTSNRDRPAAAEHHQAIPKLLSKHHDCWCCGTIILRYITIADAETGRGRTIMQTVRHP